MRRLLLAGAGALIALALTAGSTYAFECYNANRSENGNAHAANGSQMSLAELLGEEGFVGLCPDGVEHVIAGLDEQGFETDVVINTNTLMAGGLQKDPKHEEKLHDGKGIDHLSEEFLAAGDILIGEGFGICAPSED